MRYEQFFPAGTVITIVDYNGIPSGTIGRVASRWIGTSYVVRLPDGSFRWLNSSELSSLNPSQHNLKVGDIGVISSEEHQHNFAKLGDKFQVVKVSYDVDYYKVMINGEPHWFGGFQLGAA